MTVLQMPRTKTDSSWINSSVIYQVYPLSFHHAEGSESDPYQGSYGNLRGITEKADYISSLGVDAVWLCPFFASPLKVGFGYNINDYTDVNKAFGTMEDFDKLVATYHDRGIKIIADEVYNHTDISHPWFQASRDPSPDNPYRDYYVWADAKGTDAEGQPIPPNNWHSIMSRSQSAWEWDDKRQQFFLHSFDHSMPDLNINNPAVQDEIVKAAKFWFDRGVDGFRLDAVCHYGHDEQLRDNPLTNPDEPFHAADNPQRLLYSVNQQSGTALLTRLKELAASYPPRRLKNGTTYKPELLSEFNFDKGEDANRAGEDLVRSGPCDTFYTAALREGPEQNRGLHSFKQDIADMLRLSPDGSRINWAMSNHDMARVITRWFGPEATDEHAKLCVSLLMSLPGSVCLYQGEELGLNNPELADVKRQGTDLTKHDPLELSALACFPWDAARTPMPWTGKEEHMWLKQAEAHKSRSIEQQERLTDSVLNHTRQAIKLRKRTPALNEPGSMEFLDTGNTHVVAFIRQSSTSGKQMLCAFNFTQQETTINLPKNVTRLSRSESESDSAERTITLAPLTSQFTEVMSLPGTMQEISEQRRTAGETSIA